MKVKIVCPICGEGVWIRGTLDPDTNGFDLDDNDRNWNEVCQHIAETGDYNIVDADE